MKHGRNATTAGCLCSLMLLAACSRIVQANAAAAPSTRRLLAGGKPKPPSPPPSTGGAGGGSGGGGGGKTPAPSTGPWDPLVSPFLGTSSICVTKGMKLPLLVNGFPASYFVLTKPFTQDFYPYTPWSLQLDPKDPANPLNPTRITAGPPTADQLEFKLKLLGSDDGLITEEKQSQQAYAFHIPVFQVDHDFKVNNETSGVKTMLLGYGGQVPGPTIRATVGVQNLVRFDNYICAREAAPASPNSIATHTDGGIQRDAAYISDINQRCAVQYPSKHPCGLAKDDSDNRNGVDHQGTYFKNNQYGGRPLSIHAHGMATIAGDDGWADNLLCTGEYKNYWYPNNRPMTGWYHDHAIDITAQNAYAGLAGYYINDEAGPGPWGVNYVRETLMILADKVFDANGQFLLDEANFHKDMNFGDVTLVSGIPWPNIKMENAFHHLRFLDASVSRPFLLHIKDSTGASVGPKYCAVIAGDGGYRAKPVAWPDTGLFIAVAERYQVVCDFRSLGGQQLYLVNDRDTNRQLDAPMFCYSHLVARFDINTACTGGCSDRLFNGGAFDPTSSTGLLPVTGNTLIEKVVRHPEYAAALAMAKNGQFDRDYQFGKNAAGKWAINGQTWSSNRVAASDVGSNRWEVWRLKGGGGWFHPVHIHLIDMYVIYRKESSTNAKLQPYEALVPKDVVALHPNGEVWLLIKFGPHRGEYMFHCHNLRHEDSEMMQSLIVNNAAGLHEDNQAYKLLQGETFKNGSSIIYDNYVSPIYSGVVAVDRAVGTPITLDYVLDYMRKGIYRIFYPRKNYKLSTSEDYGTYPSHGGGADDPSGIAASPIDPAAIADATANPSSTPSPSDDDVDSQRDVLCSCSNPWVVNPVRDCAEYQNAAYPAQCPWVLNTGKHECDGDFLTCASGQ